MLNEFDWNRLRSVFDLAVSRLFEDAQLLEAAGFDAESEDAYMCGTLLRETRRRMLSNPGLRRAPE
jgi:hypothetical protein